MRKLLLRQIELAGLTRGDTLLVALSGGVDSVVLLHLLCALREQHGLLLQVAHLDHQIRPESAADAEFVRELCQRLDLPVHVSGEDVPGYAQTNRLSLEMAARQLRQKFLRHTAGLVGAKLIALAHHRDDQVETFFLRLLRGSGSFGLAAMKILCGVWWRPLLSCSRQQLVGYAVASGLNWVEDVSNADPAILRNRLRHHLLPQLRELNPQLDRRWAALAAQLQDENDYWQQQVAAVWPQLLRSELDGLRLSIPALLALPAALRVRVLREALCRLRGDLQRLEAVHLAAINTLLIGERSQAQLDLPGCWAARRYRLLWLRLAAPQRLANYAFELGVPGVLELPCGRQLVASVGDEQLGESATVAEFSMAELAFPLVVRNWRAGDRFAPQGMVGHKSLKSYFGDAKIELEERFRVPLLVSGDEVVCLLGERRSGHATAGLKSGQILRLELV